MNSSRTTAAVGLGLVFVASGGLKSIDALTPITATAAYDLLPAWAAVLIGAVLPALEVVIGAALLVGCHRRAAAWLAVCLGLLFVVANGMALSRGILVDCQCFGGLGGSSPARTIIVDMLVVGLGLVAGRAPASS